MWLPRRRFLIIYHLDGAEIGRETTTAKQMERSTLVDDLLRQYELSPIPGQRPTYENVPEGRKMTQILSDRKGQRRTFTLTIPIRR